MVREPDGVAVRVGRLEVGRTLPYGSCSHGWRHAEEVRRERGGADDSDKEYSWLHVRTSGFGFTVEPASASRTIASVSSWGRTTGSPPGPAGYVTYSGTPARPNPARQRGMTGAPSVPP